MKERWKEIPGYDGFYEVSDFGRVRSWYVPISYSGGCSYGRGKEPRILSLTKPKDFYVSINLKKNGEGKTVKVHSLVAKAFVKGWFKGAVVHHKDEDKHNNFYKNLKWVTTRENITTGRIKKNKLPTGVYLKSKNKGYETSIVFEGKSWPLGYYKTAKKASKVYNKAVRLIEEGKFDPVRYKKRLDLQKTKKRGMPTGVRKKDWGFEAGIGVNSKYIYLGNYKNLEDAIKVRKCAERLLKKGCLDFGKCKKEVKLKNE